uniref:Uncharacterized protein n=1 Tax=Timema poppense TaxID=170557 RepID=A0A7R9GUG9_TIMPO|nr:unnamed protein product [Timema poppensis]
MKQQLTRSHLTESCTETTKFNLHGTKKQLVTWAPTQSHTRETERGHRVSPLMLRLVCFCAGRCCGDGLIPGDPRRSPPLGLVVCLMQDVFSCNHKPPTVTCPSHLGRRITGQAA